jgi:germination protein M
VLDANAVSEGDGYTVEYGRIAVDRHFSLVEYSAEITGDDRVYITFMANGGGSQPIPVENGEGSGWLVFHTNAAGAEMIELEDGRFDGTGNQNRHELEFDSSPLPGQDEDRQIFQTADMVNGIELCCLEIEYGVAVSTISRAWEIVDSESLVHVDENLQQVDEAPVLDASAPSVWPTVTVDGEELTMLEGSLQRGLNLGGDGVGVLDLPRDGLLEMTYEHLMLPTDGRDGGLSIFQGPWTLSAQLDEPEVEIEQTPVPTEPPMVADEPTPEPEPEPTPVVVDDEDAAPETLRVLVYMVRGEEIGASAREIDYTQDVATAAISALLSGPDYEDEDSGLHSEIPPGTELLDISLDDGTLTVDLSSAFTEGGGSASILMRLAQVVHTGTQFDSVNDVQILIDGGYVETIGGEGAMIDEPMSRDDFEDQAPAILIESPAPHEQVGSYIRVRGTSNTFEANLQIEIIGPYGDVLYRDHATASSGTGTRGVFDLTIPVEYSGSGTGAIRMFEHSAEDGEPVNVVTIPVTFE